MDSTQVGQILDALTHRFAVPAGTLWAALIRQLYIEVGMDVAFLVIVGVLFALAVKWLRSALAEERGHYDDPIAQYVATGVSGIATLITLVCTIIDIGYLLNPNYGALHLILSATHSR